MSDRIAPRSICSDRAVAARRRNARSRQYFWIAAVSATLFIAVDGRVVAQQDASQRPFIKVAQQITVQTRETPIEIEIGPDEVRLLGASLQIRGLPRRLQLNAGERSASGGWLVPLAELQFLKVIAPDGLEGTAEIDLELVRSSGEVLSGAKSRLRIGRSQGADRPLPTGPGDTADAKIETKGFLGRTTRFPIAPELPATPGTPKPTEVGRADRKSTAPAPAAEAPKEVIQEADPQKAAEYEAQGRAAMAAGRVAIARLHYGRAVDFGSASAAMALAATYDPNELKSAGVIGVVPEPELALKWYQKARELGAPDAEHRIARIGSR